VIRGTLALDPGELRTTATAMLAAAALLPALPGHPGVACPLRRLTGVPCPLCGMTTSVEESVRGHLARAFAANPGGIAAVLVALLLLVLRPGSVRIPAALPFAVLAASWLFELHRYSIL
jgi:Protein of unknown function (DUF2752)